MQDLLSIIIPIYNAEKYLEKCITSVLNQTYKNIEVILVNDGSSDNSLNICRDFHKKDKRIQIIDKPNEGVSSARNAGLDVCTGMYIGFVDSDDWIEPSMYEELYRMVVNEECDFAECAVNLDDGDKVFKRIERGKNYILSGKSALKRQLESKTYECIPRIAVWSRLFKRSFWDNKRFPVGEVHEEYMLTCQALYESKKIGIVNVGLYNHVVNNQDSITHSKFGEKNFALEKQYLNRIKYLEKNSENELVELAKVNYYVMVLSLYYSCYKNQMIEKEKFRNIILKNKSDIIKSKTPTKVKAKLILIMYFPNIFCTLQDMVNFIHG